MTGAKRLWIMTAAALFGFSGCVSGKKYQRLQTQETAAKKEISQLQGRVSETEKKLGDAEAALARTRKEREELQGRLSAVEKGGDAVKAALAVTAKERDELRASLDEARKSAAELQGGLARAGQRADGLEAERDRLAKAVDEMSKSLTAKQDELSGLVSKLQAELAETKKSLAGSQSTTADYEARLREANARLDQGSAQASALAKERDQLRLANSELSKSLGARQDELARQVSALAEDKRGLESRVAELSRTADELQARKDRELAQATATYETLMGELRGEVEKGQVEITQMAGRLSVNVADTIFFDSGKAEIKDGGRKVLRRVGDILSHITDRQIRIEGHTDDVPIRGSLKEKYPTNWELSTARATTVARFLQEKAGVAPDLLTAAGYGPYRPIASNEDEAGRSRNRRIEIVLIDKEFGKVPTP